MDTIRAINNDINAFVSGVDHVNTKAAEISDRCNQQLNYYKERDKFVLAYRQYIKQNNIHITSKLFSVSSHDIDVYHFFCLIRKHGGVAEVCKVHAWNEIWKELTSTAQLITYEDEIKLRDLYCDYLLPFEYYLNKLSQ